MSNRSSVESGSVADSTPNTAAPSLDRQSHHPYAVTSDSPSRPPSVESSASDASARSSLSERRRRLEGGRIRKLIKKSGFGFDGNKSSQRGGLSSSQADLSYVERATASVGDGMPKRRSLGSWKEDGRIDDGSGGNERASASSALRETPPRTASHSSGSQQSPVVFRHSRSTNNISYLELLSLTVQSINAALLSGAVPAATASPGRAPAGPDAAAKSGQSGEAQPYMLSRAKFQPRGCVWDVSIQVLPAWEAGECDNSATWECTRQSISKQGLKLESGFEFDVKIHCVADESPSDDPDGVVDGPPDGGKAMVDTPSSLKDTATRNTYTIELTLVHDNPDKRVLWRDYPAEISGAMEWLRRKIRRKLKLSVGRRFPVPAVEIGLPGKLDFATQVTADCWPIVNQAFCGI